MTLLSRRALIAAAPTVLAASVAGKHARGDDDAPHVDMVPLSEIVAITPPQPAPPVAFTSLQGAPVTLASFAGAPLVLNFWATWCVPCVAELPELDRLAQSGAMRVVAVATDHQGARTVAPFVARHGIAHATILLDSGSDAAHALKVAGYPTTFLIDKQGRLRGKMEGPAEWSTAAGLLKSIVGS